HGGARRLQARAHPVDERRRPGPNPGRGGRARGARGDREVVLMLKTMVLILLAVLIGGTGHVLLSKGMKTVGDLTEAPASMLGAMTARALSSPWLLLGVELQATLFVILLTHLSSANLRHVILLNAIDCI